MKTVISFLFVLTLSLLACSKSSSPSGPIPDSKELMIDSTVNGTTISYPTSQRFCLELILNADAGYQWDYTLSDTNIVYIVSASYRPASGNPDQIGGYAIESFHFRTIHRGLCNVNLVEHQGWLPDVPPIHKVSFAVTVN